MDDILEEAMYTAMVNCIAMLWFKSTVYECARYDKIKLCSICFDGNMGELLTQKADDVGLSYHHIVKNLNVDDGMIWHRKREVKGTPNIFHANLLNFLQWTKNMAPVSLSIPIPLPREALQTSYCTRSLLTNVLQTGMGMGMGMNGTAQL